MMTTKERDVIVGKERVTIFDMTCTDSVYSALYENGGTRALDKTFGLTGEPIPLDGPIADLLKTATGAASLGMTEVEYAMQYFTYVAAKSGRFVGLPEDEVRREINEGRVEGLKEGFIDAALTYGKGTGKTYLNRVFVEGRGVLFPANLRKHWL